MSVNNTINDADVVYGSSVLTIATIPFETNDIKLDPEISEIMRTSSKNIGNGRVVVLTNRKGSATLMYPSSAVPAPVFGAAFTYNADGVAYTCTVGKVGHARTKAGEAVIAIDFYVNFGTIVLSVAT